MYFEFKRRQGGRSSVIDAMTFRVEHLKRGALDGAPTADLSHLIDRSYDYHSPRELRWHLAQRLGINPAAVSLRETA